MTGSSQTSTGPVTLARWTVTSGSNARSRGAVILEAGDHHWRASADGNGAIDALYRAVDKALAEILDGHPRLLAWDVHAIGEGTDTIGVVTLRIAGSGPNISPCGFAASCSLSRMQPGSTRASRASGSTSIT